jgi:hypothetical protein
MTATTFSNSISADVVERFTKVGPVGADGAVILIDLGPTVPAVNTNDIVSLVKLDVTVTLTLTSAIAAALKLMEIWTVLPGSMGSRGADVVVRSVPKLVLEIGNCVMSGVTPLNSASELIAVPNTMFCELIAVLFDWTTKRVAELLPNNIPFSREELENPGGRVTGSQKVGGVGRGGELYARKTKSVTEELVNTRILLGVATVWLRIETWPWMVL